MDEEVKSDRTPQPSEEIPRLPRGKLMKFQLHDIIRIGIFASVLVAILFMRKPCSDGVAKFVGSFDDKQSQPAPAAQPSDKPDIQPAQHLTDDELRKRFPSHDSTK